jgi:hypothetical protein
MRNGIRLLLIAATVMTGGCAGTITPRTSPSGPAREALLVLPGFGYSSEGERAIRALEPIMRAEGIDLYVPAFVTRSGLDDSRKKLRHFIVEQRLERYSRVHVFAFLAGGWTFNPLAEDAGLLPNLASIVYDRSPYQERAPRIAAEKLKILAWLRYGPVLFDVAKAPYPPLPRSDVNVGMIVETSPTSFVLRYQEKARSYGPFAFDCAALSQPHDDCIFVPMHHTELYTRFGEVWPELRAFIRDSRFTAQAERTPPQHDTLAAKAVAGGTR